MIKNMIWWQGVVEDRYDPLKLGRCRVRILGHHTDNKEEGIGIPTQHLPWATPMQPITSAAMNGIGTTPMGPVEGTWVFGFFRDGDNAQEPVMMGTFGGIPESTLDEKGNKISPIDVSKGFNDPRGKYPLYNFLDEADTNRLARGIGSNPVPTKGSLPEVDGIKKYGAEDAPSLDLKRSTRTTKVPTAAPGDISKSVPNTGIDYNAKGDRTWNEPNPRYGGTGDSSTEYLESVKDTSQYPHNHVRMSESGHVEEWDDSPGAERLHRFHKTGTFEEIQPDGTRVSKIVGNDFEIVANEKNVQIKGGCNVTIHGDSHVLVEGNLIQEVQGSYHLNVHGSMLTKIGSGKGGGNEVKEIVKGDKKTSVSSGSNDLYVGVDNYLNIAGDNNTYVSGQSIETVNQDVIEVYAQSQTTAVGLNLSVNTLGNMDLSATINMGISSTGAFNTTCGLIRTDTTVGTNIQKNYGAKVTTTGLTNQDFTVGLKTIGAPIAGIDLNPFGMNILDIAATNLPAL